MPQKMFNIVLYQPEIAPNTGNIIRLCANSGASLHIIEPLGFEWDTKKLRRAGLDYHEFTSVTKYKSWQEFYATTPQAQSNAYAFSTKATLRYDKINYAKNDFLIFGPETRGLPEEILTCENITSLTIPMHQSSRSINLANAVSIALYEALRQHDFAMPK